jgi:hypothetical protein
MFRAECQTSENVELFDDRDESRDAFVRDRPVCANPARWR